MYSPPIADSISEICMSLSCLVAGDMQALNFSSWPSKSSRIDAIHRKIVSTVNYIVCQCVSQSDLLSQ